MKITEIGGEKEKRYRAFITTQEYKTLLSCSANAKFYNAQRLGAQSLRVEEVVGLRYNQFKHVDTPYGKIWIVEIEGKDTTGRDQSGKEREVWLPDDLVESIRENAGKHWETSRQFFPKSKGTLHNRMVKTRKAAAKKTGNGDFLKVSFHDLRRYFANHYLFRHQLEPEVVRQLGGWASEKSMIEYLRLPNDILGHHLNESNLLNTAADKDLGVIAGESVDQTINSLQEQIDGSTDQQQREIVAKLQSLVDDIEGVQLTTTQPRAADKSGNGDSGMLQSSLESIYDNNENNTQSRTLVGTMVSVVQYYAVLTGLRAKKEREWMRDDPDLIDPATPYGAASLLGASLTGGVMIAFMLAMGHSLGVVILLTAIAGVISMVTEKADVTRPANDVTGC